MKKSLVLFLPSMSRGSISKLVLVGGIFILSLLAFLPRISLNIDNKYFQFNRNIVFGGHEFSFFDGRFGFDFSDFIISPDIGGGESIILEVENKDEDKDGGRSRGDGKGQVSMDDLKYTVDKLKGRIQSLDGFSAGSFYIEVTDDRNILLEIPNIDDVRSLLAVISGNGSVVFKELKDGVKWDKEDLARFYSSSELWESTDLNQENLERFEPSLDSGGDGAGVVSFQVIFTEQGLEEFSNLAKNNVGKPIAIYLNNSEVPFAMPIVSDEFKDGVDFNPTISGNLNMDQIKLLNKQLSYDELPVEFSISNVEKIDSVFSAGLIRNIVIGFSVCLFLIYFALVILYRKYGLISSFAITTFILSYGAVFKVVPITISVFNMVGSLFVFVLYVVLNFILDGSLRKELLLGRPGLAVVSLGFKNFWKFARFVVLGVFVLSFALYLIFNGVWETLLLTVFVGCLVLLFNLLLVVKPLLNLYGRGNK